MIAQRNLGAAILIGSVVLSSGRCDADQPTEQAFWVEEVVTGLDLPRAVAWLPDGRMLVTEWAGKILVLQDERRIAELEGVPKVFAGQYDGLRDIKLDPDFAANRFVYLTYTDADANQRSSHVFRARLEGSRLIDGKVIFTAVPSMPLLGGPMLLRMLFLPDKTLLVGAGSGDQGNIDLVQRLDNHVGKMVRINRDGSVPDDNPLLNHPPALPEIWALGLRNPSGLARSEDGRLWTVDIGPKGGDEFDELKPGANYGWPLVTWGFDYSGRAMSAQQDGVPGYTDPVFSWMPSFAPADLVQYRGKTYPFWDGDFFASGLIGQALHRIRMHDGKVVLRENLLTDLNERLRSVTLGPDNLLYVLTDAFGQGRLLRLRPGTPRRDAHVAKSLFDSAASEMQRRKGAPDPLESVRKEFQEYVYDPIKAAQQFGQFCAGCHTFGSFTTGHIGPDLNGINGRLSGSLPGYSYSAALSAPDRQLTWSGPSLISFLKNPQAIFSGTKMSMPPPPRIAMIQIVDFLTDGALSATLEKPKNNRAAESPKSPAP